MSFLGVVAGVKSIIPAKASHLILPLGQIKNKCVRVTGLKILGRVGTHISC